MIYFNSLLVLGLLCINCSTSVSKSPSATGAEETVNPQVRIETTLGDILVEVYSEKAPITAGNFLNLVKQGVYQNSHFYRVVRMDNQGDRKVKIEVIQGGLGRAYDSDSPKYQPIRHEPTVETGITHQNGVISMARTKVGTASSEFFICINDQHSLDYLGERNLDLHGFAAFGKVIDGMNVVLAIQKEKDNKQYLELPIQIKNISLIN